MMPGTTWSGLAVEFDKRAARLARNAFGAWVGTVARERRLDALVARLFGGGRAGCGGGGAFSTISSGGVGKRFFVGVAFIDVASEKVASCKLISTVLALVRTITGVCIVVVSEVGGWRGRLGTYVIACVVQHVEDE
jgi:hypothetical protein